MRRQRVEIHKTGEMCRIENEDARRRGEAPRDIRDLVRDAVLETGTLEGAGARFGLEASTLSNWINGPLLGFWTGRGVTRRLWFRFWDAGWEEALEREQIRRATAPVELRRCAA